MHITHSTSPVPSHPWSHSHPAIYDPWILYSPFEVGFFQLWCRFVLKSVSSVEGPCLLGNILFSVVFPFGRLPLLQSKLERMNYESVFLLWPNPKLLLALPLENWLVLSLYEVKCTFWITATWACSVDKTKSVFFASSAAYKFFLSYLLLGFLLVFFNSSHFLISTSGSWFTSFLLILPLSFSFLFLLLLLLFFLFFFLMLLLSFFRSTPFHDLTIIKVCNLITFKMNKS